MFVLTVARRNAITAKFVPAMMKSASYAKVLAFPSVMLCGVLRATRLKEQVAQSPPLVRRLVACCGNWPPAHIPTLPTTTTVREYASTTAKSLTHFDTKEDLDRRRREAAAKAKNSEAGYQKPEKAEEQGPRQQVAIEINKEIILLGHNQQWKEILLLYEQRKETFDHGNYATTMS